MKDKELYQILYETFKTSPRKWRTAKSIAKETGLSLREVIEFLDSTDFVKEKKGNNSGESVYSLVPVAKEINLRSQGYQSFIISSFDSAGDRVADVVKRALMEIGVNIIRLDKSQSSAILINSITDAIRTSDFIVVDITTHSPNVYYELGYAHGLRKPAIILINANSNSKLPSDLSGFKYIVYDTKNFSQLIEQIKRTAMGYVNKKEGFHE